MIISHLGTILKDRGATYEELTEATEVDPETLEDIYRGNVPIGRADWGFDWEQLNDVMRFLGVSQEELFELSPVEPVITSFVFLDSFQNYEASLRVDKEDNSSFGVQLVGELSFESITSQDGEEYITAEATVKEDESSANIPLLMETLRALSPDFKRAFKEEIEIEIMQNVFDYAPKDVLDMSVTWDGGISLATLGEAVPLEEDEEFYGFLDRYMIEYYEDEDDEFDFLDESPFGYFFANSEEGEEEYDELEDIEDEDEDEETGPFDVYDAFFKSLFATEDSDDEEDDPLM